MPVFDIEPGQSPEAPGTARFYEQGAGEDSGLLLRSWGVVQAGDLMWPGGQYEPLDHGFQSWSYDPAVCSGGTIAVGGGVYLTKVPVRRGFTTTSVWWAITTAGATPTAGQSEVGIYDSTGELLLAANVDAVVEAAGAKETALSTFVQPPFVWVGWVFNASTLPTLARASTSEVLPNVALGAAGLRSAKNGAGATALPATITPASNSATGALNWWAAIE